MERLRGRDVSNNADYVTAPAHLRVTLEGCGWLFIHSYDVCFVLYYCYTAALLLRSGANLNAERLINGQDLEHKRQVSDILLIPQVVRVGFQ